jgi:hypothetical protein
MFAFFGVAARHPLDHDARLLRRGRVVEVHDRRSVDPRLRDWKVVPDVRETGFQD